MSITATQLRSLTIDSSYVAKELYCILQMIETELENSIHSKYPWVEIKLPTHFDNTHMFNKNTQKKIYYELAKNLAARKFDVKYRITKKGNVFIIISWYKSLDDDMKEITDHLKRLNTETV
jgi:glucuronate isomerase